MEQTGISAADVVVMVVVGLAAWAFYLYVNRRT